MCSAEVGAQVSVFKNSAIELKLKPPKKLLQGKSAVHIVALTLAF